MEQKIGHKYQFIIMEELKLSENGAFLQAK